MSRLFVVRHGQASFLTDDYDRLSPLGAEQSRALAQRWLQHDVLPVKAFAGSLQRQQKTGAAIAEAYAAAGKRFPVIETLHGLNEYPADELMSELAPLLRRTHPDVDANAKAFESAVDDQARYRTVHRLLESVMRAWVHGEYDAGAVDIPTWEAFSGGVRATLRDIMQRTPSSSDVAVFTSGGPVGIAVQTVLESPELKAAELNWRVHNASVTRFTFSASRVSLDTFNDVSHLPAELLTYR